MPKSKAANTQPRVHFVGGGFDGQVAPGGEVDTKVDYRAWRQVPGTSTTGAQYDLYRWDESTGKMRYVGTVKDLNGPAQAVLNKDSVKWAKSNPIRPPERWSWRE